MSDAAKCETCGSDVPVGAACPRCALAAALPAADAGPTTEEVAAKLPAFEILGVLGRGGMGVVFKARQKALDRIVALKVLPPATAQAPGFADRFQREAKAMARLAHPNIVAVHEFGESGGLFYLVLEFVDGLNVREAMAAGRIRPGEALTIVPQICDALQYAHDRGVVHRDIKPENVLIDRDGRVKIADFGLAKLADREAGDPSLTGAGQVMGTLRYMAPEQWERPKEVDHRADIYSLGVVFYEMLTGELPMGKFEPPSSKARVDVRIDDVVMRAIERDRERRWQHASDVKTQMGVISAGAAAALAAVVEKKQEKDDSHWDWEGPQGMNAVTMFAVAAISAVAALAWKDGDWLWWLAGPAAITGAWCTAKWYSDRRAATPAAAAPSGRPLYDDLFGPPAPEARWSKLALLCVPAALCAWSLVEQTVRSWSSATSSAVPVMFCLLALSVVAWGRIRHSDGKLRGAVLAALGVATAAAIVPFAMIRAWDGENERRELNAWNRDQQIREDARRADRAAHPRIVEGVEIPVDVPDGDEQVFVQRPRIEALVRTLQAVFPLPAKYDSVWTSFYGVPDVLTLGRVPDDVMPGKMAEGALGLPLLLLDPNGPRLADFRVTAVDVEGDHGTVTLDHVPTNARLVARIEREPGELPRRWLFALAPVERSKLPVGKSPPGTRPR